MKQSLKTATKMLDSDRFAARMTLPIISGAEDDPIGNKDKDNKAIPTTELANPNDPQPDPVFATDSSSSGGAAADSGAGTSSSPASGPSIAGAVSDPWTTISVSYSASSYDQTVNSSSWGHERVGRCLLWLLESGRHVFSRAELERHV